MGKVTGFMEYDRLEEGYKPVADRLKDYKEFVVTLDDGKAKIQAARCMDCGTPSSRGASVPLPAKLRAPSM
jgi:glutamate synthase (NADPH) small chain